MAMLLIALIFMPTASQAQLTLPPGWIPPDYYGDAHSGSGVFRRNQGQVLDTQGNQRPDVVAQLENTPVGVYIRNNSTLSYTMFEIRNDSVLPDEGYRIDMTLAEGLLKTPELVLIADGIHNYYRGSITAENVPAYNRAIYKDVVPDIDIHIYSSKAGPRMTFVIRPGGNPETLQMVFNGQDSIKVDITGALKLFKANKWVRFEQVKAYQVNANNSITNVSWNATYEPIHNTATVGFNFGTYDTNLPLILQIGQPAFLGGGPVDERNLDWCTYAGGSGGDELSSVEVDNDGNAYVCGKTWSSDFPVAPGTELYYPFIDQLPGFASAVMMKFRATDKRLMWATYFGGNDTYTGPGGGRTSAHKLALYNGTNSSLDYAFVTGSTNCTDFQTYHTPGTPFANAVHSQNTGAGRNMWVGAFRKLDGWCRWSTTHGATNGATWTEDGLAITVDNDGVLAVGGKLGEYSGGPQITFPSVAPNGSWNRNVGGGFVMTFNSDYQINWSTAIGTLWWSTQITDMRIVPEAGGKYLWLVGGGNITWADCVPHPAGGYYRDYAPGVVPLIARFALNDHSLTYLTHWGTSSNDQTGCAYALEVQEGNRSIYIVGFYEGTALTLTECPNIGPGSLHSTVNQLSGAWQDSDGFLLKFDLLPFALVHGTLIGGNRADILLDVDYSHDKIYITGESRSPSGFSSDINPDWYYQPQYGNGYRDAILLGLNSEDMSVDVNSIIGGIRSERGYGIASSSTEVYLTGSTSSDFFEEFPLKEFNPIDPLDFYQDYNNGGSNNTFVDWYDFDNCLDYEHNFPHNYDFEPPSQPHDGFIASFQKQITPVGISDPTVTNVDELVVYPTQGGALWQVVFPSNDNWALTLYNSAGGLVRTVKIIGNMAELDLSGYAAGLFVIRATNTNSSRTAKLLKL